MERKKKWFRMPPIRLSGSRASESVESIGEKAEGRQDSRAEALAEALVEAGILDEERRFETKNKYHTMRSWGRGGSGTNGRRCSFQGWKTGPVRTP